MGLCYDGEYGFQVFARPELKRDWTISPRAHVWDIAHYIRGSRGFGGAFISGLHPESADDEEQSDQTKLRCSSSEKHVTRAHRDLKPAVLENLAHTTNFSMPFLTARGK